MYGHKRDMNQGHLLKDHVIARRRLEQWHRRKTMFRRLSLQGGRLEQGAGSHHRDNIRVARAITSGHHTGSKSDPDCKAVGSSSETKNIAPQRMQQ